MNVRAASTAFAAPEHPDRLALANEVHARPSEAVTTPTRASHLALLIDPAGRDAERAHLGTLCAAFAAPPPDATVNHFNAELGALRLTWERHGEFSSYTFYQPGDAAAPFVDPPALALPPGWLSDIPGQVLVAAHAMIVGAASVKDQPGFLADHFGANLVIGGGVGEQAGMAYTDFRVHADGYSRFLLVDAGFTPRQAGRMLQRLFEIETYRMMALLALPIAREQSARLVTIERAVAAVTADIAEGSDDDEALLQKVTRLAAEVESCLAASRFRFGACRAYSQLVTTRIAELRETRLPGLQPIGEFMDRRFAPAVATCAAVSQRMHESSERVTRASALLSTRVDIARERQNQALLASMDRRAKAQLRLQETVEGLSVAAIVYYAAGLVGYVAKGLKTAGVEVQPDLVIGLSIPLLAALVIVATRRARRHAAVADRSDG